MNLYKASERILEQLKFVIENIGKNNFSKPLLSLNNATIGQHIRHTLEFYICLIDGLKNNTICYDSREHDKTLESNPILALQTIDRINSTISKISNDAELILRGNYDYSDEASKYYSIPTSYLRELAYNIEHAVHHMAIIKIGLAETNPSLELPADFGAAVSTVRYKNLEG